MKRVFLRGSCALALWASCTLCFAVAEIIETPIGRLEIELGLPTERGARKLYNEIDFQRACQAYLWALPIVGIAEWQHSTRSAFGARDTDMVVFESLADRLGILTPNATTPYIVGIPDLTQTGPLVVDYPAGATAGGISDSWQRPITDLGETGPDKGKGGKYLVIGPGQTAPADAASYRVVQSPTLNVFVGFRILDPDPVKGEALLNQFRMYPYRERAKPTPTRFLRPEGRPWSQIPPTGLAYWERLHDILQREPVIERDRMMTAMLKSLGLEKGKPFQPDERIKELLEEGGAIGERMAQVLSFRSRLEAARYRPDSRWETVILFEPSQEASTYSQLDERASYFYEAVGSSQGMVSKTAGEGQGYLGAFADKAGATLDGGKTYRLHVPPDVPAKLFWSLTIYDAATRTFFPNQPHVDRSSRGNLETNADGSVELYVGPAAPEGKESNWIPTVPQKAWFALFRFYGPLAPYLEKTWALPDFEPMP